VFSTPLPRNRSMLDAPSGSRLRCVVNLGAFTLKTKPSGVSSCHFWKVAGFCVP
jgi:hypothetical protein